ncbi:MAG: c-type cytochrome [Dehalococcoidia bacterium]
MRNIAIALVVTLVLAVGGVAITFAFRSPADSPKIFAASEFDQADLAYRQGVVNGAFEHISRAIVPRMEGLNSSDRDELEATLARVRSDLFALTQDRPPADHNRRVEEITQRLDAIGASEVAGEIAVLREQYVRDLAVKWLPDPGRVELGRSLYRVDCATCHGSEGDGESITPEALSIVPRDFTGKSHSQQAVVYKFSSTDRLALDEDLSKTIKEGLPGTPMPGFSTLTDSEVNALLDYIKTFGYVSWKYQQPQVPALAVPATPTDLGAANRSAGGRELYSSRGCVACHGDVEQGGAPLAGLVSEWSVDGEVVPIAPRNFLTEPLRRPDPPDVFQAIRLGIKGTPMVANNITDDETWNLIAYIFELRRSGQ